MSNNAVGALYKRIMDQVLEASRPDFEENGVDSRMIDTLQQTWQHRLSMKHSAHYPWEPQPAPSTETPTTNTSGPSRASQTKAANAASSPIPPKSQNVAPQIKQEASPNHGQKYENFPQTNPYANIPNAAEQRAYDLVQQRFGNQAKPAMSSMNALGNIQLPSQQQNQQRPGAAYGPQYTNQQYQQQQHQQQGRPQGQMPAQQIPKKRSASPTTPVIKQERDMIKQERDDGHLIKAQVDGAGDSPSPTPAEQWTAVMAHRAAVERDGATGRHAADGMIRAHVAQNMQRLEGGGLLVPLEERYPRGHPLHLGSDVKGKGKGKENARVGVPSTTLANLTSSPSVQPRATIGQIPAQLDGSADSDGSGAAIKADLDDDEKDGKDVDAINSDLDDSEDEVGDGMIGDDYEGNQIICLYDKVQRVKNKWKCVLKDGVVDVDGRDYVFHKATGEFEW